MHATLVVLKVLVYPEMPIAARPLTYQQTSPEQHKYLLRLKASHLL